MKIEKVTNIDAAPEEVWCLIGGDSFGTIDRWASDIARSSGDISNGMRTCATSLGNFKETVTSYDDEHKQLSYRAQGDKMPFFVKRLENNWRIFEGDRDSQCRVAMRLEADLLFPFNLLMGIPMKMQLKAASGNVLEELKYFAETGEIHPRKTKAIKNIK